MNDIIPRSDGSENLKILKKSQLRVDCGRCRQTVEVGVWPWCWEVGVWPGSWDFEVGPWKTIVEFLPLGHRVGFWPLKDVVSIVWYERLLRIVSLLVSKNRSQKLINGSYLNNGVACVFESAYCVLYFPVFACITVVIDIIELWLQYTTQRHKFKPWIRLNAFHKALIPLRKVWIWLFSSSYE